VHRYRVLIICLFLSGLFNDALGASNCVAANNEKVDE
jgi:hypothetical protein